MDSGGTWKEWQCIHTVFTYIVFRLRFGSYRIEQCCAKFGEGEQLAMASGGQEASLFQV